MEMLRQILAVIGSIPPAAIIIFLIISMVIAIELWRLRPQRERPPIPTPPDMTLDPNQAAQPGQPPDLVEQTEAQTQPFRAEPPPDQDFSPLSTRQIGILVLLLILIILIPIGVLLYQRLNAPDKVAQVPPTQQTKQQPSPGPATPSTRITPRPTPRPTRTPRPTLTPGPSSSPTPLPTLKPTISPIGTTSPTPESTRSNLPSVDKPSDLPDAGAPIAMAIGLVGSGALLYGLKRL